MSIELYNSNVYKSYLLKVSAEDFVYKIFDIIFNIVGLTAIKMRLILLWFLCMITGGQLGMLT